MAQPPRLMRKHAGAGGGPCRCGSRPRTAPCSLGARTAVGNCPAGPRGRCGRRCRDDAPPRRCRRRRPPDRVPRSAGQSPFPPAWVIVNGGHCGGGPAADMPQGQGSEQRGQGSPGTGGRGHRGVLGDAPDRRRGSRRRLESHRPANRRSRMDTGGDPHRSGAGDSEHFRRVAARSLDGGVGWRLHGGPGTGGPKDDAARLAGRCSGHPSEPTLPEDGIDAQGIALFC